MNRKRNIIVLSAIGILALVLTTGWNVLAGDGWPPEPYKEYSIAGVWAVLDGKTSMVTVSPEDPKSGTGFAFAMHLCTDPTYAGSLPDATSQSPCFLKYVRTGPNSWQYKGVVYILKDAKPQPIVLMCVVVEGTVTVTAPDTTEWTQSQTCYLGSQNKDLDGLPDEGEEPIVVSVVPTIVMKSL